MSLYFLRISTGRYSGAADQRDAERRMEPVDENKRPVFRISLVDETAP